MKDRKPVLLLGGKRTAIADFGRALRDVPVDKLAQHVLREALLDAAVNHTQVDGVILGNAYQTSLTPNLARFAWLNAGFAATVPGYTLHIQCGSGMKAVNNAMDAIKLGNAGIMVAGGAESMSTIPYLVDGALRFKGKRSHPFQKFATEFAKGFMPKVVDSLSRSFADGLITGKFNGFFAGLSKYGPRPYIGVVEDGLLPSALLWDQSTTNMAGTAQNVADLVGITRKEMDAYGLRSQQLAMAAVKSGRFDREIAPFELDHGKIFARDEHPRETSMEALAKLRRANPKVRDITAGNSSGINDAACALVLASEERAAELGLKPLSLLIDHVEQGVAANVMGLGPVEAINALLARNGLTLADIDLVEINEAFAAQTVGCAKMLGIDLNKLNVNGGAIALGHPIAMSGARVILTLAHELKLRGLRRGIASLCIGGGMGIATLIENPDVA